MEGEMEAKMEVWKVEVFGYLYYIKKARSCEWSLEIVCGKVASEQSAYSDKTVITVFYNGCSPFYVFMGNGFPLICIFEANNPYNGRHDCDCFVCNSTH